MSAESYLSWGGLPRESPQAVSAVSDLDAAKSILSESRSSSSSSLLAYGLGRSYGDVCLNGGEGIISTRALDHLIAFDEDTGRLRAEAGVSLAEVLDFSVRRGWFLPVSPGTKFVTLGGAVANDIHGKNHHLKGTFGRHVLSFGLLRSDGELLTCSRSENSEVFAATISGLGLTGLIVWVEVQLKAISGPFIDTENIQFDCLEEFYEISADSAKDWELTVAWLDCVSSGANFGRGIFMRGNHSSKQGEWYDLPVKSPKLSAPIYAPSFALNKYSVKAFNTLYYHKQLTKVQRATVHYEPYFYPLDAVSNWHRIYGRRGFYQFQCVLPPEPHAEKMTELLEIVVRSGRASFLAVLKEFGSLESPGMLSFPREGTTICLDFANEGAVTRALMSRLERLVVEQGGSLYPAKDALMKASSFQQFYPKWKQFSEFIDPAFSSSFWRRVTADDGAK